MRRIDYYDPPVRHRRMAPIIPAENIENAE